ncbi:MAG: acyl-CoA thioesterase [Parcubacteria group bacterium]|nr:acyl-CoA thioesterase [Parcubacteria group bacterium]
MIDDPPAKKVSYSVIDHYPYQIFHNDLNAIETVFGGRVLEIADRLAGIVAQDHSNLICVTLLVDSIRFLAPARRGETLVFKASVNRVWGSSMEIGIKVFAGNLLTCKSRHVFSAYFTFVAVDADGKSTKIQQAIPETEAQKRRYKEADIRRINRLRVAQEIKDSRL